MFVYEEGNCHFSKTPKPVNPKKNCFLTFLGETASQTLEVAVALDSDAWIGISRSKRDGTETAVSCDVGVGSSDFVSLTRSSDRISLYNFSYFPRDTYREW